MHDEIVAGVGIGVGGDIRNHAPRAVRRARLKRLYREVLGIAAARSVSVGLPRTVVPDHFARTGLGRSAAADDVRAGRWDVDVGGIVAAVARIVVSGSRQHDHARVSRGLGGVLQLLYQVLSELLSEASPIGLVGAPRDRAYVASIGGGRPHGGGNAPEIVASPVDSDVRGSARRDEISGGGHLDVHRDL